jgi:two-component system, LytTR family, sensor kinase
MTSGKPIQRPWLKWTFLFLFWSALGLGFAAQFYLSRARSDLPIPWSVAMGRYLPDYYIYGLLSIPVIIVARRFPAAGPDWSLALPVHVISGALFSLGWMVLRAVWEQWRTRTAPVPTSFDAAFSQALGVTFFFNLLVYGGIVAAHTAVTYYRKFHERELHAVALETRLTEARLQALQMQLNPHFLFNTLNAIASLMHTNVDAADRMLVRLSELLRYALDSTNEQEVPLRKELDFLTRYLDIQRTRFGERLVIQQEIAPETLDALVPNLILQPLVENAIEHGIEPRSRAGEIVLRSRQQDGKLTLEVCDNGLGLKGGNAPDEGIGLSNTRARLEQLYGAQQRFEIVPNTPCGVIVRLEVPFRPARTD